MNILVTGSAGMLGTDICIAAAKQGIGVIEADIAYSHGDPRHYDLSHGTSDELDGFLGEEVDAIIHCAAMTNVEECEEKPLLAELSIRVATKNVADLAFEYNIPMIYVSTDYVFGNTEGPHEVVEKPDPLSVYGMMKKAAEDEVLKRVTKGLVVRTAGMFGGPNDFVLKFIRRILTGQIRAVNTPTSITYSRDIADFLLWAAQADLDMGLCHFANAGYTHWYDIAWKLHQRLRSKAHLGKITPEEFRKIASAVKRPLDSRLDISSIPQGYGTARPFQDALECYVEYRL